MKLEITTPQDVASLLHCTNDDTGAQVIDGRAHLEYLILLQTALQEASVTHNQFMLMASLHDREGYRATPSELSLAIGRTPSNVTLICNQLVACGWVLRGHGSDNRRRVDIRLTTPGLRTIKQLLFELRSRTVPVFDHSASAR